MSEDPQPPMALRNALQTMTSAEARVVLRWIELCKNPITKISAIVAVHAMKGK